VSFKNFGPFHRQAETVVELERKKIEVSIPLINEMLKVSKY
jgi:hypothetical protein